MIATADTLRSVAGDRASSLDIQTLLDVSVAGHPDATALEAPTGETISYRELAARVRRLAGHLRRHGVRRTGDAPDRVAIVLPNGPPMSLALLAAATSGVAVPFNPAYRPDEYETYFRMARVGFLLVDRDDHAAARIARDLAIRVVVLPAIDRLDERSDEAGQPRPRPDEVALVLLTSGSTGHGKVVPLTHRNLCRSAADVCRSVELDASDRVLSMWEQFHIGGVVDLLLAPLAAGGTVITGGGFDASRFFEWLEATRPTWFQGVPTTLRELCHVAESRRIDCRNTSLRFIRSVAAALPEALCGRIEDRFGVPVVRTFGMTEAAPLITSTPLPPRIAKPGSVGFPCGPSVRILDDRGRPLDRGRSGQVAIRGMNVFTGYEGDPAANAAAFLDDWFLTGDLGHLDADGELFLTGRAKELINRGGEKVAPQEVDEVLARHPAVAQVAAFGLPHPTLGEDVAAAVVLRDGAVVSEAELRAFAGLSLAAFKLPRRILFVDDLPRCPVGKVRRRDLAVLALSDQSARGAAPTTPLEAALATLWAEELDIDAVGIDDDWSALGGDSLASVRILLATEALVGMKIADRVAGHCSTVRSLAADLVTLGCPSEGPWQGADAGGGSIGPTDVSRRDTLLTAVAQALVGRDRMPDDALHRPRTLFEFEVLRHTAENISTPAELGALLAVRSRGVRRLATALSRPLTSLAIARRRGAMRREFQRTIAAAERPNDWRRTALAEQADLFHGSGSAGDATLVVGFASRSMRLATPTCNVLCGLDPTRHDLVLLRDPARCHYRDGVPGLGDGIESVAAWLAAFVAREGYGRVVALGTSSGGLPAICTAILNRWPRVVACGADRPSSHAHLRPLVAACGRRLAGQGGTEVILAYAGRNVRDTAGAAEIGSLIPAARQAPDERFADHALLHELHRIDSLRDFLSSLLLA